MNDSAITCLAAEVGCPSPRTASYNSTAVRKLSMICDTCIGVLQHRDNLSYQSDGPEGIARTDGEATAGDTGPENHRSLVIWCGHHLTSVSLARSAAAGCHICQPVWDQCSTSEKQSMRAIEEEQIATNPDGFEFLTRATTTIKIGVDFDAKLHVAFSNDPRWRALMYKHWRTYLLEPRMFFPTLGLRQGYPSTGQPLSVVSTRSLVKCRLMY